MFERIITIIMEHLKQNTILEFTIEGNNYYYLHKCTGDVVTLVDFLNKDIPHQ